MTTNREIAKIVDRYAREIKTSPPHRHATIIASCEDELRPLCGQKLAAITAAAIKPKKGEVR